MIVIRPFFLSQGNSCVCEGPPKDDFIVNMERNWNLLNVLLYRHGTTMRRNNELQFAGTYGEFGVRYTLKLPEGDEEVRSRQVSQFSSCMCCD